MFNRLIQLPTDQNLLLFGARGTGKSTWLQRCFKTGDSLWLNLLNTEVEERFARHPEELIAIAHSLPSTIKYIVNSELY